MTRGAACVALLGLAVAAGCGGCGAADGSVEESSRDDGTVVPPPVGEGRIETPAGPLAWVRVGEGPALVVVHGGPGLDHRYLRPWLDELARGRSVVYWDQRGLGRSVPADGTLDTLALGWEATLADLDRVAERFGDPAGRVSILAHSWGALPALAWALSRPDRLRALVLVSPVEPGDRFADATRRRRRARTDLAGRARLDSLLALPRERRTEPGLRSALLRASFRSVAPDPAVVDRLDLDLLPSTAAHGDVVARRVTGTAGDIDLWDELGRLDVPVLVVQGAEDLPPPGLARALAGALPRGRAAVLDGAGHFPFAAAGADAPGGFTPVVDAFLGGEGAG